MHQSPLYDDESKRTLDVENKIRPVGCKPVKRKFQVAEHTAKNLK